MNLIAGGFKEFSAPTSCSFFSMAENSGLLSLNSLCSVDGSLKESYLTNKAAGLQHSTRTIRNLVHSMPERQSSMHSECSVTQTSVGLSLGGDSHSDGGKLRKKRLGSTELKRGSHKPRYVKNSNKGSKYRGVCWSASGRSWKASLKYRSKNIHIGYFKDEEEAARAYDERSLLLHGDDAIVNFESLNADSTDASFL